MSADMSAAVQAAPAAKGAAGATLVTPPCGALLGQQDAASGVRSFKGIPYALPPVGERRWKPPQPMTPWAGVRPASGFGADSPQTAQNPTRAPGMSEDCLFLNVWAPAGAAPGSLPVMVWLHGGSFVGGSGADARVDGQALAARGAVVVTLNYRVGLFGFMAHPALSAESPDGVSGNYGLLDQICALRWVQDNITGFGGDPSRVTLFGVSAGSASISLLLVSPQAKGLFSQAILQSPGAGRPLASLADAEQLGLQAGGDIQALRALDADAVLALTPRFTPKVRGLTTPRVLRPVRDGWLIPQDERPAFLAGKLHAMPILIGSNLDEGSLLTAAWPVAGTEGYSALVEENFGGDAPEAIALYPAAADAQVRTRVAELFADTQFNYGTRLLARAMAAQGKPVWRYLFTRRRPGQGDGPHHGEEVAHAFGNLSASRKGSPAVFDATDESLSDFMMASWVAFAATGNPDPQGGRWPAYQAAGDQHLVLGDQVAVGQAWRAAQLDFLETVYSRREPVTV